MGSKTFLYQELTQGIEISVEPRFVPEKSNYEDCFFYAYDVSVSNHSAAPCMLKSRHWIINMGYGEVEEVRGDGVVGEQPMIKPGEKYTYTSFCPLPRPTGNMRGTYYFEDDKGEEFEAKIPLFFLKDESLFAHQNWHQSH